MTKADKCPDQAEADMNSLQEEARAADDAQMEATERVEELERQIDATNDPVMIDKLLTSLQNAEVVLEDAKTDFESVMNQIGRATRFCYE